jgi:hypothetical protein
MSTRPRPRCPTRHSDQHAVIVSRRRNGVRFVLKVASGRELGKRFKHGNNPFIGVIPA